MIIEFKFKNFKNFKNETLFSFRKGNKRELNSHVINYNNQYKLLPIKVIYGCNSSGKTNLLKALKLLRKIVVSKTVRDDRNDYLGLCSNFDSLKDYETPILFSLKFVIDSDIYDYKLVVKNNFNEFKSEVLFEELKENDLVIFQRNENKLKVSNDENIIKKYYARLINKEFFDNYISMVEANLDSNQVFSSWFSAINKDLSQKIVDYFKDKIKIIINVNEYDYKEYFKLGANKEENKEGVFINDYVNALIRELKVGNQELFFKSDSNGNLEERVLYKSKNKKDKFGIITPAMATESKGTLKMIDLLIPFLMALDEGIVLLIDELDASIHHEIIYNIVQSFGNPKINKKGAQLIFTTHNPVYLNKNLLRRDEIVFVEKNSNNEASLATLDDYDLRNDEVYLKNYLAGSYTILPNFDMSHIIKAKEE